jgi:hypothetical protein
MTQKQFNTLMDHYNNDNESEILAFAEGLLQFSSFLGIAFIVMHIITN